MPTPVKKKVTRKKAARKPPLDPLPLSASAALADATVDLVSRFEMLLDRYEAAAAAHLPDDSLPQELVVPGAYLAQLDALRKKLAERVELTLKAQHGLGGFSKVPCGDHRLAVVSFPVTKGSVRPKWQEVAVALAEETFPLLHAGGVFDGGVYIDSVKQRTAAGKDSTKVAVTFAE